MTASTRRLLARFLAVAAVFAGVTLVGRACESRGGGDVQWKISLAPLGPGVRHVEVSLMVGDRVLAWHSRDDDGLRPWPPIELATPAPGGEVTITVDVVAADGAHRVVRRQRVAGGAAVTLVVGE
ncbi:MAG: hypothetical protein R3B06_19390 [Kofleriaceae bacterium]